MTGELLVPKQSRKSLCKFLGFALVALKGISQLEHIAPVHAGRGNCDHGPWAQTLPKTEVIVVNNTDIYMIHDLGLLDLKPEASGFALVIYGHSHQPSIEERDGVLYVNPGSAGPKRFSLPVSVAHLHLNAGEPRAEIIALSW